MPISREQLPRAIERDDVAAVREQTRLEVIGQRLELGGRRPAHDSAPEGERRHDEPARPDRVGDLRRSGGKSAVVLERAAEGVSSTIGRHERVADLRVHSTTVVCSDAEEVLDVLGLVPLEDGLGEVRDRMEAEPPRRSAAQEGLCSRQGADHALHQHQAIHPIGILEREQERGGHSGIDRDDRRGLDVECVEDAKRVSREAPCVVARRRPVAVAEPPQIGGDHAVGRGERRDDRAPDPPGVREAVQQQDGRPLALGDDVESCSVGLDCSGRGHDVSFRFLLDTKSR